MAWVPVLSRMYLEAIHAFVCKRLPGVSIEYLGQDADGNLEAKLQHVWWEGPRRRVGSVRLEFCQDTDEHTEEDIDDLVIDVTHVETKRGFIYSAHRYAIPSRLVPTMASVCIGLLRPPGSPYTPQEVTRLLEISSPFLTDLVDELSAVTFTPGRFEMSCECKGHHVNVTIVSLCLIASYPCPACEKRGAEDARIRLSRNYHEEDPWIRDIISGYVQQYVRGVPPRAPVRPMDSLFASTLAPPA